MIPPTELLIEAAEHGPLQRVEDLLGRGALAWEPGVLEAAERGHGPDRDAIVALLARPVIRDPDLREAVAALLFLGPDQADRDYTLELVMTSAGAREQGHQIPLMHELLEAGATATPNAVAMALAHQELDAVRELLRRGHPMTQPIAAALGELRAFPREEAQLMLALAVINDQVETARRALEAGADVNAFLPIHGHSTALHQAALSDDPELIALLLEHGARRDIRDTVWDGTPLDWAIHEGRQRARDFLEP